ncbi:MAG: hypothetical protein IJ475_01155 [Bacilli bacterium]|nr:hypothetical protein [Bacilli bacterium]
MEKNMRVNFEWLERRVVDAIYNTDTEKIRYELRKINKPCIISGVGGSSVVSTFASRVIGDKNRIITEAWEPRDFLYRKLNGFENVLACSYGGNNYGVKLAFCNKLKHYLLSNNKFDEDGVTYLWYDTTIDKERSFISLGATLIPVAIMLNYYMDGDNQFVYEYLDEYEFNFDTNCDAYEIFSGYDTATASKYLESTFVEAGIGLPIVHDKYSYCHGRTTTSINYNNVAIYLYRGTDFDKMLIAELSKYYKDVVILKGKNTNSILDDYQMLVQAMYLTKYIAEQKSKDLSKVEYSELVKKLYNYEGKI